MARTVHIVIHRCLLLLRTMWTRRITRVHCHSGVCRIGGLLGLCGLLLLLLCSLLRQGLRLLLLLYAGCRRSAGRFEIHLWLELTSVLLLRDERMRPSLLR